MFWRSLLSQHKGQRKREEEEEEEEKEEAARSLQNTVSYLPEYMVSHPSHWHGKNKYHAFQKLL